MHPKVAKNQRIFRGPIVALCLLGFFSCLPLVAQDANSTNASRSGHDFSQSVTPLIQEYCVDCHGSKKSKGDLNFEPFLENPDVARNFKTWELMAEMLEFEDMPPEDESHQPSASERQSLLKSIRGELHAAIHENAGDPGNVTLRRLTSAEYAYTIQDLTGLELDFSQSFTDEAVGGEGFSNVGEVQFMQDATLERYLEAAKQVASHAVIGAGPLTFYRDPGRTGQELFAINRIQSIYQTHGFRTGAGEGAKAYGTDQYAKAFLAAWQFRHRNELGLESTTLDERAQAQSLSPRFVQHIWKVLNDPAPSFPSSDIVARWKQLPQPESVHSASSEAIQVGCSELYSHLLNWQKTLAASSQDDEEYPILTEELFQPKKSHSFRVAIATPPGASSAVFEISVKAAAETQHQKPAVLWRNPQIQIRKSGESEASKYPLRELVSPETAKNIRFGQGPNGTEMDPNDFATYGSVRLEIEIPFEGNRTGVTFLAEPVLDVVNGDDCLARCEVTDGLQEGETIASSGAASALLSNPESPKLEEWKSGILAFAQNLAQVSHREPTPSDRDWIPAPFDNTYNKPERNYFHTAIKYHRDDSFLTRNILDQSSLTELDQAWTDLLTSFDYHDTIFRFILRKFEIESDKTSLAAIDDRWISRLPPAARSHTRSLLHNYQQTQAALQKTQARHLDDLLAFTAQAWRRPLAKNERNRLKAYYSRLRSENALAHPDALRALLTRILVAPEFVYRIETPTDQSPIVALSDWELASRLSYFIWASKPDPELLEAAAAGELKDPEQLAQHARRMLQDPKARRFATEFFGQWFGFYRFDEFRGIDTNRFSDFTDELKASLYNEAISFFEYIVTEDRPVNEIVFADYAFLDENLAAHYNIPLPEAKASSDGPVKIDGTQQRHRGGILQLGAVLATTSAPLRTSAVKRGDWILRRVLGTPTPPPPADAGSIPADETLPDGKTVRERLEAHRRESSCVNCHTRIDPLGFALENFNPVGQWRETYRDGGQIDTTGILNDGTEIGGMDDLYSYLRQKEDTFHRNLCKKLLGYALGRAEIVSDRLLIDKMVASLDNDSRFSNLVLQIVTSRQFRHKRGKATELASDTTPSDPISNPKI